MFALYFSAALSGPMCVKATSLNIRTGPGTNYGTAGSLSDGVAVDVVSTSNGWSQLSSGNYVSSQYLVTCPTVQRCTTANLNVRELPVNGRVIKTLASGAAVTVYGKSHNGWVIIGPKQFVSESYLGSCQGASTPRPVTPTPSPGGGGSHTDKIAITLRHIFTNEGGCQNWNNDSGNWLNGKKGYTCAGITPGVGYNGRDKYYSYAISQCSSVSAELFVKCAWDLSQSKFNAGSETLYTDQYFRPGGCADYPQPLHFVCSDIAVNSGPGRSKQYIRDLGSPGSDFKGYARRMNQMHREDYIRWSQPGSANAQFRAGWLARADSRDKFINTY
jgi:hypothetical protein